MTKLLCLDMNNIILYFTLFLVYQCFFFDFFYCDLTQLKNGYMFLIIRFFFSKQPALFEVLQKCFKGRSLISLGRGDLKQRVIVARVKFSMQGVQVNIQNFVRVLVVGMKGN